MANLLYNAYQMVLCLKNVFFRLQYEVFWQKTKIRTLEKFRKYGESFFARKKRLHLFKLHLYQIGKEQNMPVVAGRLASQPIKFLED